MVNIPRLTAALAACTCLTVLLGACTRDEPATYLPLSGTWTYEEDAVVSNSCADMMLPDPLMTFNLDYDSGDEFQIELGAEDVVCEIDGTEFFCGGYLVFSENVDGFDALVQIVINWSGEFSSAAAAEGNEVTSVTCTGADCNLLPALPCTRDATFTAEFFN